MNKVQKFTFTAGIALAAAFTTATAQVWDGTADTTWYTNDKDATEYTITTPQQLAGLALLVNGSEENGTYDMEGKTITLGNDIMLNETENWQDWETIPPAYSWMAIGGKDYEKPFQGTFDGNGHVVSGVYINTSNWCQGLFGYLGEGGTIKNLGVVDSYIKGYSEIGGLVGGNNGTISNSYSTNTVTGSGENGMVGGLVGRNGGTISNSYSTSTVTGSGENGYVGGLVGRNGGTISNSYSTSTVTGSGENGYVGGLVGSNGSGTISNSYSTGAVSGNNFVGGLVGSNGSGTISNSYSAGSVSGNNFVGGLVGNNVGGTISYSYSTGVVTGNEYVDGLVGDNYGTISDSYVKTTAEMQSQNFISILNLGAIALPANNVWVYSAGKYPELSNTPIFGTETNPYIITTKEELEIFSAFVNAGNDFDGKYFKLGNDIALNDTDSWEEWETNPPANSWTVIGKYFGKPFRGTFDGDGHVVSGVYINTESGYQGLFGYLGEGGMIKNVGIVNSYIKGGNDYVGGLVGRNEGTINDSYSTGMVMGNGVGGLVGYNYGTVSNSYSTGTVTGNGYGVGGLVGGNDGGTINDSYSTGIVTGDGDGSIGGLVGGNYGGTINDSYSTGEVTGNGYGVGGLVGGNDGGTINDSYSTSTVTGTREFNGSVGGLMGWNSAGTVTNSYSEGTVTGDGGDDRVGGLVGSNRGTVINSYSKSTVTRTRKNSGSVGGLVGDNNLEGTISNSYSTGAVSGDIYVGGLVGENMGGISNSYSTCTVVGTSIVGGLVGQNLVGYNSNGGIISNSYSTGTVSGNSCVGGLVGQNRGGISNSYSTGAVSGDIYVGGLIGYIVPAFYNNVTVIVSTVINSYSIGAVSGNSCVGGLVGSVSNENEYYSIVYNSYYDSETSGQTDIGKGIGKSTTEMKQMETYADWNFNATWVINNTINNGYPYLDIRGTDASNDPEFCEIIECDRISPIISKHKTIAVGNFIAQAISDGIMLSNLPQNAKIEVYNLSGKRMYLNNSGNSQILKIPVQTKGLYVVRVGKQSLRVAVH